MRSAEHLQGSHDQLVDVGDGGDKVSNFEVMTLTYLRVIFAFLLIFAGDKLKGRWSIVAYLTAVGFLLLALVGMVLRG